MKKFRSKVHIRAKSTQQIHVYIIYIHTHTRSTYIIDNDIAEKLLVEESTEHNDLRFPDINSRVTTVNPKDNL